MASASPQVRRVVVATHGHCFDGAASAALFTRLVKHVEPGPFEFHYRACGYGPGQNSLDPGWLDGDVNAVLDFRYTTAPQLTWYFDHHRTAFQTPGDREHFDANQASARRFHDETYGSCSKLIADVGRERFGFHDPVLDDLVRWADIIDSARFKSAEQAVMRAEPELRLMTVLEHQGDAGLLGRIVPMFASMPLGEVASSPEIVERWSHLGPLHEAFVDRVRSGAVTMGPVVYVDLTDQFTEVVGKFVTYALFPESAYSVMVSRARSKCKISVGYNPWSPIARTHDISAICTEYGGGGHAVVGAVSLPHDAVEDARKIGMTIANRLAQ
ncbi:MAG: hypothetical protein HY898_28380 [Deltaproteobacteria bacterium]|nr:hypothetical protein [Deltaproteobacteria bacterium]